MRTQRGFSLLESVIVFSLIAIVVAIAAPKYQKMTRNSELKARNAPRVTARWKRS